MTPDRRQHHDWLGEFTQIPTAAGRESRVIDRITRWAAERPAIALSADPAGNLHLAFSDAPPAPPLAPIYFTAHLDHPAFVVERIIAPGTLQLAFRGGVMDDYFHDARITIHSRSGSPPPRPARARLIGTPQTGCAIFKSYLAELDGAEDWVVIGDIATWDLPPSRIEDGLLHAPACDDLAAVAAALGAFHHLLALRGAGEGTLDVRLLFTRAEEVGFLGAIAACRHATMPPNARIIALENSRSFDDSPIGGGPIVRVGDRLSIFSPALTGAIARCAEQLGGPAQPTATQKRARAPRWRWQRKLMPGGACEATVFCAAGYEAACLCLPLGNYHNMADLAAVQAGENSSPPRIAPEFISIADFDALVDLLVACGRSLPDSPPIQERIDKLWSERSFILGDAGTE